MFDAADRLLLFRGIDAHVPGVHFWFTPGGGVETGEELHEAARRELFEETGCTSAELGPAIWTRSAHFSFPRCAASERRSFLARVPSWEVDMTGFSDLERRCMIDHRWWTVDELRDAKEPMYPTEMPALVCDLLRQDPPAAPIEVGP